MPAATLPQPPVGAPQPRREQLGPRKDSWSPNAPTCPNLAYARDGVIATVAITDSQKVSLGQKVGTRWDKAYLEGDCVSQRCPNLSSFRRGGLGHRWDTPLDFKENYIFEDYFYENSRQLPVSAQETRFQ